MLRASGFLLTLAASCGLATLHFSGAGMPHSAGGVLGDLVGNGLAGALSFLGATLLLLALVMAQSLWLREAQVEALELAIEEVRVHQERLEQDPQDSGLQARARAVWKSSHPCSTSGGTGYPALFACSRKWPA